MDINARFAHVNIVAGDWKRLARFYEDVFGCTPVPPERDISGRWLEEATGIPGVRIRGIHLRLPGLGGNGPTLEIFQYDREEDRPPAAANRPGFAHIAFVVDDVDVALEKMKSAGGGAIGKTVSLELPGAGTVRIVYATDPEENIVELQKWSA